MGHPLSSPILTNTRDLPQLNLSNPLCIAVFLVRILQMVWGLIKFHLKKWWAKFRLKECIKSEQSLYRGDLEHFVLERPRLLDADYSTDVLTVITGDNPHNGLQNYDYIFSSLAKTRPETLCLFKF